MTMVAGSDGAGWKSVLTDVVDDRRLLAGDRSDLEAMSGIRSRIFDRGPLSEAKKGSDNSASEGCFVRSGIDWMVANSAEIISGSELSDEINPPLSSNLKLGVGSLVHSGFCCKALYMASNQMSFSF
jgi:hypothetical protein